MGTQVADRDAHPLRVSGLGAQATDLGAQATSKVGSIEDISPNILMSVETGMILILFEGYKTDNDKENS